MRSKAIITKPIVLALILFIITLFIRVLWLDKFPVGIVNDNMIFVLNAKAVYFTGTDVSGLWHPLKFSPIPDEPPQAELPYTLMAPFIGPLPSSLFSAHIFHAIINTFFVLVLFFLVLKLVGKWPAFIVALVACFNPWNIFFGRSAFEVSLALFFYTLGFFVLHVSTGWKKLLAIIPLAFGFYTYMAYKLTFLPFLFLISLFSWSYKENRKFKKQYVVLVLLSLCIFLFFVLQVKNQSTNQRLSEVTFFSNSVIENQVNAERRLAIENPFTAIFSNKLTVAAKNIVSKYIGAFSIENLFINNEWTQRFHIYNHGYFYYADFIFFLIGFWYLLKTHKKLWIFLISLLLIAPIPSVASNVGISYAMRSSLYIPAFYIFIGMGIWHTLMYFRSKKLFNVSIISISGIYILLISNFLYTYFFIQPTYAAEGAAFSHRLVSRYAALANQKNKLLTVVSSPPKGLFKDFIFYSDSYNKQTASHFRNTFLNHTYSYRNVSFTACSDVKTLDTNKTYIFDPGEKCELFKNVKNPLTIVQLSDSGTLYSIYQDSLCSKYRLKSYVANLLMRDFEVEKLSEKEFCETFIIDYSNK